MITKDYENIMYDKFIESPFLTTQELLSIGFTNKDLIRLKEMGKIASVRRGVYELVDAEGLYQYACSLNDKRFVDKRGTAFMRCFDIKPDNSHYAYHAFYCALWKKDYDLAFKCIDTLDNATDSYCKGDCNLYLLLLSYITEIPDRYKDRVKNMVCSDLFVSNAENSCLKNGVRGNVFDAHFGYAMRFLNSTDDLKNKRLDALIFNKLLSTACYKFNGSRKKYYDLIMNDDYEQLAKVLDDEKQIRHLGFIERNLFLLASDMVSIRRSHKVPHVRSYDGNFEKALGDYNYDLAFNLFRSGNIKSVEIELMLEKIISEIEMINDSKTVKKVGNPNIEKRREADFTTIKNGLIEKNFDKAFTDLDTYLKNSGKSQYSGYITLLIKLDLLKDDLTFTDSIATLSDISCGSFEFDASSYFRGFYLSIADKDFRKAAIYLDILSRAEEIGGVLFDTTNMKNTLVGEMRAAGVVSDGLVDSVHDDKLRPYSDNNGSGLGDACDNCAGENVDLAKPLGDTSIRKEKLASEYCQLATVIDNVISGDNVALLEPMSDEDTENVLYLASCVPKIKVSLVDSTDGKSKHVVLRYVGRSSDYIPRGETIRAGNSAYRAKRYSDCIELFERVLPSIAVPRSFIYKKLGLSYAELAEDGDYHDAIDYLTIATSVSKSESEYACDFSEMVEDLKKRTGYNGIKIKVDSSEKLDIFAKGENAKCIKVKN